MKKYKLLASELKATVNGLEIIRCEEKRMNYMEETSGQTHVWYDVCDCDEDILESFKTLREAKKFAEQY
jgi:hypothetical protein